MIVSRTCTEISRKDGERPQHEESQSRPLEEFRDSPAYVLLGDPGAGKTTAFEMECEALGEQACKIPARDFLTFDPKDHPEWRGKTLFIDGLDEVRAGSSDVRTPFDQIRGRLNALGKPCFRLSCREADWLGENDRKHLESVSPDSAVRVLRLDPLKNEDIASMLDARPGIPDAKAFMAAARARGIDGLLANPQTLEMLADVVAPRDEWPKSRKETFEMACGQMVREHNEEHQAAREAGSPPEPDRLLDAAGRLGALQLISGGAGYTLRGQQDEDYPAPDQCDYDSPEEFRFALSTKLFKGTSSNRFTPVHRHVAEFLGAWHLAKAVQDGLPARRVISLMAGEDGTVVTEMRGLSAWLAAHSRDARAHLIERDPIGVGLYGDIGEFSLEEKRALLESLNREGIRLGSLWSSAVAFRALATPEIEPVLREILKERDRSSEHQAFTDFVLRILDEGVALPSLSGILLEIVRDDTRWSRVNTSALNALIHNCPDTQDKATELKSLVADIRAKRVSDPDNELLGILLYELFPRHLSPSQVWDIYFETSHRDSLFGMYWWFFWFGLLEKSSDDQVAELLDTLSNRLIDMRPTPKSSSNLENLPVKLLARGLQAQGAQLAIERLYGWLDLGVGMDLDESPIGDKEDIQEICCWLEQRPEVQKILVMEGLERCPETDEFWWNTGNVMKRWYGAKPPSDFGLWCLKQAVSLAAKSPLVAEHLLEMAFQAHRDHSGDADLSLEILEEYAQKNVRVRNRLDQLLSPSPIVQKHLEYQEKRQQEREAERQQWFDYVQSNETALLENRAPPHLLYHMADLYFKGPKAIEECVRGDRGLTDAVLHGLRRAIDREDVPDLEAVLRLREQNRMHYLGLPFLAGIAEAEKTTEVSQWEDDRVRKAIAFYYCSHLSNHKLQWYRRLLDERPEIVAEVHVQFAVSGFRNGREHIDKLSELALDHDHTQVARHASLPLLRAFPTRCKATQIQDLKYLLWAAFQFADRASLRALIGEKCSQKSMDDAQRVYWLATGIIVEPEGYGDRLEEFVQGREDRISHLMVFLEKREQFTSNELGNRLSEVLLRLAGNYAQPDQLWNDGSDGGYVGSEVRASEFVHSLIKSLSISPEEEASHALERLLDNPALSRWQEVLVRAQDSQRVIRRDVTYRHPDIEQVCRTLNGGTPANAADLAALVMDLLQKLADQILKSDADDWSKYWNVDSHGRPVDPRHESTCRNTLLSDLRKLLPERVSAGREGQHRNDKRDDIWVSCLDCRVPVEVKRNANRRLWRALRDQLIAQYTSTPSSDGYGIYLVFWFGKEHTQPPPSGGRPAGPGELSERLAAEANLSAVEARKISICVVDVSRPDG